MILDVVHWNDLSTGCNRCAGDASHYTHPYWDRPKRVCETCCIELARFYDRYGWPPADI